MSHLHYLDNFTAAAVLGRCIVHNFGLLVVIVVSGYIVLKLNLNEFLSL